MKKFVLKSVLWGRSKEKRLERREETGVDEAPSEPCPGKGVRGPGRAATRADGSRCACCLKPFVIDRGVRCTECGARICKNHCSRSEPLMCDCWCCLFCYQQRTRLFHDPRWLDPYNAHRCIPKHPWTIDPPPMYADKLPVNATWTARTALRKLVDRAVDEVCKSSNSGKSPLNDMSAADQLADYEEITFPRKSYDDLLKMIIVNKVIEKSRLEQLNRSNSVSNMMPLKDRKEALGDENCSTSLESIAQNDGIDDRDRESFKITPAYTTVTIEEKIEEFETSSLDGDMKYSLENSPNFHNKSLRVPFPELGVDIVDPNQVSEEETEGIDLDDLEYTKIVNLVDSWKDNWLFRKKHFKQYSKYVSMFVPSASIGYRAMIGDRDVDETSDLSEYSTNSDEDVETELTLPFDDDSLELFQKDSAQVIPSDNKLRLCEDDEDEDDDDDDDDDERVNIDSSRKDLSNNVIAEPIGHVSLDKVNSNAWEKEMSSERGQELEATVTNQYNWTLGPSPVKIGDEQESEYTERIILFTKGDANDPESRLDANPPSRSKRTNGVVRIVGNGDVNYADNYSLAADKNHSEMEEQLNTPPRPGSIAEREHKKWENAASMKNNPYSKENIQRRLMQKNYVCPFNLSRFNRDRYVDDPIASKEETNGFVESDSSSKSKSETNCHSSNSDAINVETEDKIKLKELVLPTKKERKLPIAKSENRLNSNVIAMRGGGIIETVEECKSSDSLRNNKILDDERKNNKNEVHAKLNNQEQVLDGTSEIDLRRRSFERNELPKSSSSNKLDAKHMHYVDNRNLTNRCVIRDESNEILKSNLVNEKLIESMDQLKRSGSNGDVRAGARINNRRYVTCKSQADLSQNGKIDAEDRIDRRLSMPSVKRLVQVFDKKRQVDTTTAELSIETRAKESESKGIKALLPKQLHSLTARSLSKEFREGLRQIPNKIRTDALTSNGIVSRNDGTSQR